MPSIACKHPTCCNYVRRETGQRFCAEHAEQGRADAAERTRFYDQHVRNPDAKEFYNSAAWAAARRQKLAATPVCERCQRVFAEHVHHIVPLAECTSEQRTAQSNLMSLCAADHNAIEAEARRGKEGQPR